MPPKNLTVLKSKVAGTLGKALLDKKSVIINSKTVTVKIVRVYIAIFHLINL
jgi:hypothetical protein